MNPGKQKEINRKKTNREKVENKLSFLKCEINLVVFLLYREASQHNVKKYISNDVRKSNNLPNLQLLTTNVAGHQNTDIVISLNLKQSSEKIGLTCSFIYKLDVKNLTCCTLCFASKVNE